MNVGKSTRIAMASCSVSCAQLQDDLEVSSGTITNYRKNEYQSGEVIHTLANRFGMSDHEFIKLSSDEEKTEDENQ